MKKKLLPILLAALLIIAAIVVILALLPAPETVPDNPGNADSLTLVTGHPDPSAEPAGQNSAGETEAQPQNDVPADPQKDTKTTSAFLTFHFLNVEQGDCIFLELPDGKTTLIDCGEREYSSSVISQLLAMGHTRIDYLFATHPHSDHIGGMRDVIATFDVGDAYLPKVTANTASYEKMLEALNEKKVSAHYAEAGMTFSPCEGVEYQILAPIGDVHDGLNNWSIVLRVVYGDTAALFCGDAELESVDQMLDSGADLSADLLKLGHHGSSDGLTKAFFRAISPSYAIACCAEVNDYGHPHREVVQMLKDAGVPLLCTYEGNIVFASDGSQFYYIADEPQKDYTQYPYIGNKNSKKFHRDDCDGLPGEANRVYFETRDQAVSAGYSPCPSCNP